MKPHCLVSALLFIGAPLAGCVESSFELTRASPIPAGLRSDPEAVKMGSKASRIQLWLLQDQKAELRFYLWDELVLKRAGYGYRNARPDEGPSRFFVTFSGVESKFHQVTDPSIVEVEDKPLP
jgi:hypothetical protein